MIKINIDTTQKVGEMSKYMYGLFLEELNHAGDSGLYSEKIRNRSFQDANVPNGAYYYKGNVVTPKGYNVQIDLSDKLPGWSLEIEGDGVASMSRDSSNPRNPRVPHSVRLDVMVIGNGAVRVMNTGYWGISIKEKEKYDVRIIARASGDITVLTAGLEHPSGAVYCQKVIKDLEDTWKTFEFILESSGTDQNARFFMEVLGKGTLWFDYISVFPQDTFMGRKNGFRKDLAQMLKDLKPSFLRFPGGCVVEGVTLQNAFRWKSTLGPVEDRPGFWDLWGYWTTAGIGYHEYLQLCEDLNCAAMYVANCGMSCQACNSESADEKELKEFLQDALDAIEYAVGPVDTEWGKKRADNGHPAPFDLKFVEIGNENHGTNYEKFYKVFYHTIKEKYPELTLIANVRVTSAPMDLVDDHFYTNPGSFVANANHYDQEDRKGPGVYVGEYGCNTKEAGGGNLAAAISEAAYMIGLERNADIVKMASYAPLLCNVNSRDWPVNLICFDNGNCYGVPSYYVQKVFSENRGNIVLDTQTEKGYNKDEGKHFFATASIDKEKREIIIKAVNFSDSCVSGEIRIDTEKAKLKDPMIVVTGGCAEDENSFVNPQNIRDMSFSLKNPDQPVFKPWSLTILRAPY